MVSLLLYAMLLYGLVSLFTPSFAYTAREAAYSLRRSGSGGDRSGKMDRHLLRIIRIVYDGKNESAVLKRFRTVSLAVFLAMSVLLWRLFRLSALPMAAVTATVPYGYLRLRLALLQKAGSFEGESLIREIRNQYRLNHTNMIVAVDLAVAALPDSQRLSKRALFRLSLRLKTYKSREELNAILSDFCFNYNTHWARMLANNIYNSVEEHADVTSGLDDLLDICRDINTRMEKDKQQNTQSASMTRILGPILFVTFYLMAASMLSWEEIAEIQLRTRIGVIMLMVMVLTVLLNIASSALFGRQKYDI